jgi:hypothetical protein
VGVYLRQIRTSGACGIQPEQLDLSAILDALSDPVPRSIVLRLAEYSSANCSNSYDMGSKINLTGHHACIADLPYLANPWRLRHRH